MAKDNVSSLVVIKSILDDYEKENIYFDCIFNIFPASPLLQSQDLKKALRIFQKKKNEKTCMFFQNIRHQLKDPIEQKKFFIIKTKINYEK